MSNDDKGTGMPTGLPPEIAAMVARAQEYQRMATTLQRAIEAAGIEIEDLSVAFSGGAATLSGVASSRAASDRAAQVVRNHEGVQEVRNGIAVVASEAR